MSSPRRITGAAAILLALEAAGVTHFFVNLGSDHPAFIAAFAGQVTPKLQVFTAPNEMNALSAASGFAQITGRPAAVLVHVECGTQGLGAAVHNISKGRIPVFIFAGTSPVTMEGEHVGSRNEYIHWIQDVPDQRAIVRQYMKFEHEIRSPHNAAQLTLRALQFATSSPQGPVYMIASREILEAETDHPSSRPKASQNASLNLAVEPIGLSTTAVEDIVSALLRAERPLLVTSYAGRSAETFTDLVALAKWFNMAVHENAPIVNSFPTTSPLHQGHQWNGGGQLPALEEADVILVVDSDVPWIPQQSKPNDQARILHIDSDPLKTSMTLWSLPCEKRYRCDSKYALRDILSYCRYQNIPRHQGSPRNDVLEARFTERQQKLLKAEEPPEDGSLTVPYFMARFREATADIRVIALNESTTNLPKVADHLRHTEPLSLLGSGGGGLGWYSGAAVGVSLALQSQSKTGGKNEADSTLITAFTGDGTFIFGVPTSAYWMARKYETPYLTVVWNNGGWAAPRAACLRVHGNLAEKHTERGFTERAGVGITPSVEFGKIAEAAGGAWWRVIESVGEVDDALREAVRVVREEKMCALIEVRLKQI